MRWAGVDIGSRRVAIACPDEHYYRVLRLEPYPKKRGEKPAEVRGSLHEIGWWIQSEVPRRYGLLVEMPVAWPNIQTAIRMGMTAGAIMLAHTGVSVGISNSEWKAAMVGNGRASKDEIRAWLTRDHPSVAKACGQDQDLVDAAGIALAAGQLLSVRGLSGP